jgi:rhodanese-related sulfurtransferase
MSQLIEFVQHHPLLVSLAGALAVVLVVIEIRLTRQSAASVGPADAVRLLNSGAILLDVRNAEQFATGHIIDARNIEQANLASSIDSIKKFREKVVIVCCDSGITSRSAANTLKGLGFTKVVNLNGGLQAWKRDNLPVVTNQTSTRKLESKKSGKAA